MRIPIDMKNIEFELKRKQQDLASSLNQVFDDISTLNRQMSSFASKDFERQQQENVIQELKNEIERLHQRQNLQDLTIKRLENEVIPAVKNDKLDMKMKYRMIMKKQNKQAVEFQALQTRVDQDINLIKEELTEKVHK